MKKNKPVFESDILAIMPEKLDSIMGIRLHDYTSAEIEAAKNRRATKYKNISGNIAIIPVYGFISQKPTIWSDWGFETSSEQLALTIEDVINDSAYGAVILDVDSPGGTVFGLTSISDKIYSLRDKKPIIAVSNSLMASAAYFIGSAASEIIADPDSETGCIGTIAFHAEASKYYEEMGINITKFASDKFKGEGNPYEPLTEEAKKYYQEMVNGYADVFVSAVARNREKGKSDVKSNFGQGRTLTADKAKEVGMVDRVATFNQVINDLMQKKGTNSRNQAQLDLLKMK